MKGVAPTIEVGQVWAPTCRNSNAMPRFVFRVGGPADKPAVWWADHPISPQAFTARRMTLGAFRGWVRTNMAVLTTEAPGGAHPTALHERVADADLRTAAVEPPPYRPGNPMWDAGWRSAQAQAAALAATAGDPHVRILAMRPTAPKVTA